MAQQPAAPAAEETWSVEDILDDKAVANGTHEFLIKWQGCPPEQNSWEPLDNLLAGEWNPKDEVIDYLKAKYNGDKVLVEELPENGTKGRIKYTIVSVTGEETWSVEDILDDKTIVNGNKKTHEFLIKWLGCPPEQNSWEPLDNLLAGEWNPKEEVIDYLEAKYKGGMVLLEELPEKGTKGKIKYSIVTKEKQREMQRKGMLDVYGEGTDAGRRDTG